MDFFARSNTSLSFANQMKLKVRTRNNFHSPGRGISNSPGTYLGLRGNQPEHPNIICDECLQKPFVSGIRFKSLSRIDFDLCERCANLPKYSQDLLVRVPFYNKGFNREVFLSKAFEHFRSLVDGSLQRNGLVGLVHIEIIVTCEQ